MRRRGRARAAAAAAVACAGALAAAAPARAEFRGTPGKVAFLDAAARLSVYDPARGGDPVPLTGAPTLATGCEDFCAQVISRPVWSPDGTQLAFVESVADAGAGGVHTAVFVINADGTGVRQVSSPPDGVKCNADEDASQWADASPTWSPDGRALMFVRLEQSPVRCLDVDSSPAGIYLADPGGGGESRLLADRPARDASPTGAYLQIAWVPGEPGEREVIALGYDRVLYRLDMNGNPAACGPDQHESCSITDGDAVADFDVSPDGKRIAYSAATLGAGGVTGNELKVVEPDGFVEAEGPLDRGPEVRFSPDGNGVVHRGCAPDPAGGADRCGLVVHRLPDPGGDVFADEPDEKFLSDDVAEVAPDLFPTADVQAQQLPIVFLPGFLGSTIVCGGGDVMWPPTANVLANGSRLEAMRLTPDGSANATVCGAKPDGTALGEVVGKDIYQTVQDWLDEHAPGGAKVGHAVFGWDWRRTPQPSLGALDGAIDKALQQDLPKREGASRVVLFGHSYGGLLARWYVEDPAHARRVARVLTAGTPWWGSPKVVMPLAFGIETPVSELGMDMILPNDDLQALARTIPGLFELFPSDHFGAWLSVDGDFQDQAGVADTIAKLGADPSMFDAARAHHDEIYDGFYDDDGRIDVRAVVGTGLPTFATVDLGRSALTVDWTNGDGTVPLRSAAQGDDPGHPLGDRVHVQEICGVGHVALPNTDKVLEPYADFLLYGRTPRRTEGGCPSRGSEIHVFDYHVDLPEESPQGLRAGTATRAAAEAGPVSLAEAFQAGLVDLLDLPGGTDVITNARHPVQLSLPGDGVTFTVTSIDGEQKGGTLTYGPVSGDVVIDATADPAQPPAVTADGSPVTPRGGTPPPASGGGGTTPPPSGSGGGGTPPPPPGGPAPGGDSPPPAHGEPRAHRGRSHHRARLRVRLARVHRQRLRSLLRHGLRARATCSRRCRLMLTLTLDARTARRAHLIPRRRYRRHRHARVRVGRTRRTLRGGRRTTVRIRLSRRARRHLRHTRRPRLRLSAGARDGTHHRAHARRTVRTR